MIIINAKMATPAIARYSSVEPLKIDADVGMSDCPAVVIPVGVALGRPVDEPNRDDRLPPPGVPDKSPRAASAVCCGTRLSDSVCGCTVVMDCDGVELLVLLGLALGDPSTSEGLNCIFGAKLIELFELPPLPPNNPIPYPFAIL